MEAILKQIKENIEGLQARATANQTIIDNMKSQGLRPAMYGDIEKEIYRIGGQIDTFVSCYQMIANHEIERYCD